jgi:hypothetical protein
MRKRKPTPEEMALAIALGFLPAERAAAISAALAEERESLVVTTQPRLCASDVRWLRALGVRWN